MLEDELLKWKFKSGSTDALQRIYEKYRDYLLTISMAILNDAALAEDIVHDVFVTFVQSNGTFKLRGSLKGYLATCTVNRCRDRLRSYKRQPLSLDENVPMLSGLESPVRRVISDEQSQHLAQALAQLPYEQREVIALHINGEMKLREIARLQKVSTSTIKGRYRYGLKKLRSILNGRLH